MNRYIDRETFIDLLAAQREFYNSQQTKSIAFRKLQLKKLKNGIKRYQPKILEALHKDLRKSEAEVYFTEISLLVHELNLHITRLGSWAKRVRVQTPLHLLPSKSYIQPEPLGISLIIAPWNYPFQLTINPLIGAISAGCCALVKPSPFSVHTSQVIDELLSEIYPPEYIKVIHGSKEENEFILKEKFDVIFFTGSPTVGRVVMKAASEHLTPVILELGGKSPCIVDSSASIPLSAKRIAWSKAINAGQTCIAPDYLIVHSSVKDQLISEIIKNWKEMLGDDMQKSPYYNRIIHKEAYERLSGYLRNKEVCFGGTCDPEDLFISPTLIDNISFSDDIMQQEIFGPILPIITFDTMDEVITQLTSKEKPLAMYYYGVEKTGLSLFEKLSFGGGCINDGILHVANNNLPFGGVGSSGQGRYHGKSSFDSFTHYKGIMSSSRWFDLAAKYPPYKYFKFLKRFV